VKQVGVFITVTSLFVVSRSFILCKLQRSPSAVLRGFVWGFIISFFFPNQYHVFLIYFLIFNQRPWIDHTVDAIAVGTAADKFAAEDPDRRLELLWEILLN
jgi:hypothetical protein